MAGSPDVPAAALNYIVDHSALLAGLSDTSAEDLKQWVANGLVNLFVPLYTLEKLNNMRSSPPPLNLSARRTLEWLDDVTTSTEGYPVGRVELQGPDDQYENWKDVERYLLPDTPLSSGGLDGVTEDLEGRLRIYGNDHKVATALRDASEGSASPDSSPDIGNATIANHHSNQRTNGPSQDASDGIPSSVWPLLNCVVWRTYHNDATIAGSGKYILLTNDRITQKQAQKFGVRAKLLSQVASVVAKATPVKPNGFAAPEDRPIEPREAADEIDEDVVVFNPAQRPGSSRGKHDLPSNLDGTGSAKLLDPDHFGRSPGAGPATSPRPAAVQPASPMTNGMQKPAQRGQRSPQVPRTPSGPAMRGQYAPTFRGGRGRGGSMRRDPNMNGRPHLNGQIQPQQFAAKPIDPDSYVRPNSMRGRGNAMRRLWNPNT